MVVSHACLPVRASKAAAHGGRRRLGAVAVLPDQLARLRVERLQRVPRVVEIDDAVVDDRRGLAGAPFAHRPRPDEPQVLHVAGRDLRQRAVVGCVVIAPQHQPVAGIGIAQHRVGHRHVIPDFSRDGESLRAYGSRRAAAASAATLRRAASRGLPGSDRVDRHARVFGERLRPRSRAVLLQDERRDVRVGLGAERARACRRHRQLDERQEIAGRPRAPAADEFGACQRRRRSLALQIGLMTGGAVRLIRGAARRGLRRGERRALLLARDANNRDSSDDHRHDQKALHRRSFLKRT